MKKIILMSVTTLAISFPFAISAMEHDTMNGGGHSIALTPTTAYEEVVDGIKVVFNVQAITDAMNHMGMDMPKGMKETHHISVTFKDIKKGKTLTDGTVSVKVQNPDSSANTKELMSMQGHFGADFELWKKGKYGVMCKFRLKDGKTRHTKFWYTVK